MKIITTVDFTPKELDLLMSVMNFVSSNMKEISNSENTNLSDALDWLTQGAAFLLNQSEEGTKRYEAEYGAY